jgi:hypothetical protein
MTPKEALDEEIKDLLDGLKSAHQDTKIWSKLYLISGAIGSLIYSIIQGVGGNTSFTNAFVFSFGRVFSVWWFFVAMAVASAIYFYIKYNFKYRVCGRVKSYADSNDITPIDMFLIFSISVLAWSPMFYFY